MKLGIQFDFLVINATSRVQEEGIKTSTTGYLGRHWTFDAPSSLEQLVNCTIDGNFDRNTTSIYFTKQDCAVIHFSPLLTFAEIMVVLDSLVHAF